MTLNTMRHDEVFDKNALAEDVHVIGVGGIGSAVVRQLAKLGVGTKSYFHVWDGDTIEAHNVCNQAYNPADVGRSKVVAITDKAFGWGDGLCLTPHPVMVTERVPLSGVVFLCLDSMQARKDICEQSLWHNPAVSLVIETRMDATHAQVHAFDPRNETHIKWWNLYFFPDTEAEDRGGCNGPISIISTVEVAAGLAVNQFTVAKGNSRSLPLCNQVQLDLASMEIRKQLWESWEEEG